MYLYPIPTVLNYLFIYKKYEIAPRDVVAKARILHAGSRLRVPSTTVTACSSACCVLLLVMRCPLTFLPKLLIFANLNYLRNSSSGSCLICFIIRRGPSPEFNWKILSDNLSVCKQKLLLVR